MLHRIYGSIHFQNRKNAAKDKPITPLEYAPDYVVLPLSAHPDVLCQSIVVPGDKVLVGQKIAEPVEAGGISLHSPVSGTVSCVESRPGTDGTPALSVVIDNDFQNTPAPVSKLPADPDLLTCSDIASLLNDAGVVDLGATSFSVGYRLLESIGYADTLIIDATEVEAYVTAEHRLILERSEQILSGIRILMQALSLSTAIIAVTAGQTDALDQLRKCVTEDSGIQIVPLKSRYPFGAEKPLIQKLTGRRVPPGGKPCDVKCAVFNLATTVAIYDAIYRGLPLTRRIVTVSGSAVKNAANLEVPIGTPLEYLLDSCGGLIAKPRRVLLGGPMTGTAQKDLSGYVTPNTNILLFASPWEPSFTPCKESPCIRCGRCVKACPMKLLPANLYRYAQQERYDALEKCHISDCIECGNCTYVCPAHIPLTEHIREAKRAVYMPLPADLAELTTPSETELIHSEKEDCDEQP